MPPKDNTELSPEKLVPLPHVEKLQAAEFITPAKEEEVTDSCSTEISVLNQAASEVGYDVAEGTIVVSVEHDREEANDGEIVSSTAVIPGLENIADKYEEKPKAQYSETCEEDKIKNWDRSESVMEVLDSLIETVSNQRESSGETSVETTGITEETVVETATVEEDIDEDDDDDDDESGPEDEEDEDEFGLLPENAQTEQEDGIVGESGLDNVAEDLGIIHKLRDTCSQVNGHMDPSLVTETVPDIVQVLGDVPEEKKTHSLPIVVMNRSAADEFGGATFDFDADFKRKRVVDEPEPPLDESEVQLDSYNGDLNMKVCGENRSIGEPLTQDGFALMWAAIKASYGVRSGKWAYQVKVLEFLDISHLTTEETYPHDMRIGWSIEDAPYCLGEAPFSYAYCSIAKKAERGIFSEWGQSYERQDVITCCIDLDTGEISYWKNKEGLGAAFTVQFPAELDFKPTFFPHVATKNCKFQINFGQLGEWIPIPEGFKFINVTTQEERIRGLVPLPTKRDCMVLMMVGLPGCGKTRWVNQYLDDHPEERWTVISTDTAMDMMKVNGVPRHRCHHGRWDVLMGLTAKAVNKLLQLACRRKKNYIIDQTNVTWAGRRRKITLFRDFGRKAVVLVPADEDFANRRQRQVQETGREIPAEAMLELKSMFFLPEEEDGQFDDIIFIEPESGREMAQRLVERYNEEGKAWKPYDRKRSWAQGGGGRDRTAGGSNNKTRTSDENNPRQSVESTVPPVPASKQLHIEISERRSTGESEQSTPSTVASPSPAAATSGGGSVFRNKNTSGSTSTYHSQTQGKPKVLSSFLKPGWAMAPNAKRGFAGFEAGQAPSFIPPPPGIVNVTSLGTFIPADAIRTDPVVTAGSKEG